MKILRLPIHCHGLADLDNGDIVISTFLNPGQAINTFVHESAHLLCERPDHDRKWRWLCHDLLSSFLYTFDVGNIHVGNIAGNVGNVTGIQNILLDYHLLQSYRKFSKKVLGTEGQWEVKGDNQIRLFPTPRGSYPVMVEYYPVVYRFRSPSAREICKRAMVAEAKIILGNVRSKFGGIPSPDGGTVTTNGDSLRTEGQAEKEKAIQDAILLGEPIGPALW